MLLPLTAALFMVTLAGTAVVTPVQRRAAFVRASLPSPISILSHSALVPLYTTVFSALQFRNASL